MSKTGAVRDFFLTVLLIFNSNFLAQTHKSDVIFYFEACCDRLVSNNSYEKDAIYVRNGTILNGHDVYVGASDSNRFGYFIHCRIRGLFQSDIIFDPLYRSVYFWSRKFLIDFFKMPKISSTTSETKWFIFKYFF